MLLHISSRYSKILGETNFHTREFPRSSSKAKDGDRKKERPKVGNNNDQLRITTPPWVAQAKPPGQKKKREERLNYGNNNGQLRIATPPRVSHAKPPGPKTQVLVLKV